MIKIFVSQPMNGLAEADIRAIRRKATSAVKERFPDEIVVALESIFHDVPQNGNIALKFLAWSLEVLANADYVVFCPGWEDARGCRVEHKAAEEYGIKVIELSDTDIK